MSNQDCGQNDTTNEIGKKSSSDKCVVTGIYGLRNSVTGKWYIGQSLNIYKRWRTAYQNGKCKSQPKIYAALKKYGYDVFEKVVIEECTTIDWILDYREMYWIRHLNSIENGYNIREGGCRTQHSKETRQKIALGRTGWRHTEEAKAKMSAIHKGKKISDEHRLRLSQLNKGRLQHKAFSEETRQKMRIAKLGRVLSVETRLKMRLAHLGKKNEHWSRGPRNANGKFIKVT